MTYGTLFETVSYGGLIGTIAYRYGTGSELIGTMTINRHIDLRQTYEENDLVYRRPSDRLTN